MTMQSTNAQSRSEELRPFHGKIDPTVGGERILLLSYNFPPAPTAGSLRWQKMATFAQERGWAMDAITLTPEQMASKDPQRLMELPDSCAVFGVPDTPHALLRIEDAALRVVRAVRRSVRALRGLGRRATPVAASTGNATSGGKKGTSLKTSRSRDESRWLSGNSRDLLRLYFSLRAYLHELSWGRRAARLGKALARHRSYSAVITSGPPHLVHVAGSELARQLGIPHVADFRDPWSLDERVPEHIGSQMWFWLASRSERRVVKHASLLVLNTEASRLGMAQLYPEASARMITVNNGYDVDVETPPREQPRFVMSYAGTIYMDRNPEHLLEAAGRVVRELLLTPSQFGLEFVGQVQDFDNTPLEEIATRAGIRDYVRITPSLPRHALRELLAQASVLVSLPQNIDMAIPSKVFEYMPYHAWLLALATRGSATELLLRDTRAKVVDPLDVSGIADVIRDCYLQYRAGTVPSPVAEERFSRRSQASKLLDALDRVTKRQSSSVVDASFVRAAAAFPG